MVIAADVARFQVTKGYGDVERQMLLLILSWVVMVHKLQCPTLDKAEIELGKKNFAKVQVCVAMSVMFKLLSRRHAERALSGMTRLRSQLHPLIGNQ